MAQVDELVQRGHRLMREDRYKDALACFEQALLLDQSSADLWNYKGIALRSLGRYEESVECFNRSLEIDPRDRDSS